MRKITNAQNYADLMLVEALFGDSAINKRAQDGGIMSGIIDKIKGYVSRNIDPNDKIGSVINMLAPGVISALFGGKLGLLMGLAMRVFHIDVASILETIWSKLKEEIGSGKSVSSEQVNNIVQSSVQEHTKPATEEEAEQASKQTDQSQRSADDGRFSFASQLRLAKIVRLAIDNNNASWFSAFSDRKSRTSSFLSKILSFVFRAILSAAGIMVAGDAINKLFGRPSAIDTQTKGGVPVEQAPSSTYVAKQTKFPPNPSYQNVPRNSSSTNWIENVPNTVEGIEEMLVRFTNDVYQGLRNYEQDIRSNPIFQTLVNTIAWHNHTSSGGPIVFIPQTFKTKKQLVDTFIDDIANKIQSK